MSDSNYNPKRQMLFGYAMSLVLAGLVSLEVSFLSLIIAIWVWTSIVVQAVCTPVIFAWAKSGNMPDRILSDKNKKIAQEVPFYMYVIGFVFSSFFYSILYQYYPVTAAVGWTTGLLLLASFTYIMDQIRDLIKLKG